MRVLVTSLTAGALLVSGCAKHASDVAAAYRSPMVYQGQDCAALHAEEARVRASVAEVSAKQDEAATRDAIVVGVGAVLFWPALFVLAAGDEKVRLSELKGEHEAIQEALVMNRCGPPAVMTASATPVAPVGTAAFAPAAPAPMVPAPGTSAARPVEGQPLSAFTAQEMRAYCGEDWETRVAADGRTEYNPCRRADAFL